MNKKEKNVMLSGSDRELVHKVCVEFDKLLHPKPANQKPKETVKA